MAQISSKIFTHCFPPLCNSPPGPKDQRPESVNDLKQSLLMIWIFHYIVRRIIESHELIKLNSFSLRSYSCFGIAYCNINNGFCSFIVMNFYIVLFLNIFDVYIHQSEFLYIPLKILNCYLVMSFRNQFSFQNYSVLLS